MSQLDDLWMQHAHLLVINSKIVDPRYNLKFKSNELITSRTENVVYD